MLRAVLVGHHSKRLILAQHLNNYKHLNRLFQLIHSHCFLRGQQLTQKAEAVKHYRRYYMDFVIFTFIYIIMKENNNI